MLCQAKHLKVENHSLLEQACGRQTDRLHVGRSAVGSTCYCANKCKRGEKNRSQQKVFPSSLFVFLQYWLLSLFGQLLRQVCVVVVCAPRERRGGSAAGRVIPAGPFASAETARVSLSPNAVLKWFCVVCAALVKGSL